MSNNPLKEPVFIFMIMFILCTIVVSILTNRKQEIIVNIPNELIRERDFYRDGFQQKEHERRLHCQKEHWYFWWVFEWYDYCAEDFSEVIFKTK